MTESQTKAPKPIYKQRSTWMGIMVLVACVVAGALGSLVEDVSVSNENAA